MPHIHLEYSNNIKLEQNPRILFNDIHQLLTRELPTEMGSCKSRAVVCDQFLIGEGEEELAFAHLHVKVMAGRSPEKKTYIGHVLLEMLSQFFHARTSDLQVQLSVEIEDLDAMYFKKKAAQRVE